MGKGPPRDEVERVIAERIRPLLKVDGGDIRLEKIAEDGKVFVSLVGRCAGCPGASHTMATLVEPYLTTLKRVKRVVLVPWQLGPPRG